MKKTKFDVSSLGSTMMRLSVPFGKRIAFTKKLDVSIGGTESNTMIALSHLGAKTAWVSKLKLNPVGKRIINEIIEHEVDTSKVIWTNKYRNEIYFLEFGGKPRRIEAIYDRTNSAISNIKLDEIDFEHLFDTKIFHFTGIFSALSKNCLNISKELIKKAHKNNVKVSFDINFRSKLWTTKEAQTGLEPILSKVDLLFATKEDISDIFNIKGKPKEIVKKSYLKFKPEIVIISFGEKGCIAYDGKKFFESKGYDVDEVDRVGAGDCFSAGFLYGYLQKNIRKGMEYGSAMAAIKMSISGDLFLSDIDEVEKVIKAKGIREVGR